MADHMTFEEILGEVDHLKDSDKIRLVELVMHSLRIEMSGNQDVSDGEALESLFGMWRDRDVTLSSVRARAWQRN